jgi:hypothetical protein
MEVNRADNLRQLRNRYVTYPAADMLLIANWYITDKNIHWEDID